MRGEPPVFYVLRADNSGLMMKKLASVGEGLHDQQKALRMAEDLARAEPSTTFWVVELVQAITVSVQPVVHRYPSAVS